MLAWLRCLLLLLLLHLQLPCSMLLLHIAHPEPPLTNANFVPNGASGFMPVIIARLSLHQSTCGTTNKVPDRKAHQSTSGPKDCRAVTMTAAKLLHVCALAGNSTLLVNPLPLGKNRLGKHGLQDNMV